MEQHSAEVRPLVQTMPSSEAFMLQTGGSARRRVIKPSGEAPTITFRVSGVPGHTHNACAVASVLCDLGRNRGFSHDLTDAWADEAVEMKTDELGDSDVVDDANARFSRAIERGVGEITLIPENCHQQIREPTRSIAEVRALVAPADRLRTLTYVEEVGGFVAPKAPHARHISDYPDILVDMLGQRDLNKAHTETYGNAPAIVRYSGVKTKTPVSIRSHCSVRNGNGSGEQWDFVVLQDGANSVGLLPDFKQWHGIVPFRWVQAEKKYRSESFTVTLRRTVEVGPKEGEQGEDLAAVMYPNQAAAPLTVTFPAMETAVAANGYCLFVDRRVDTRTVLLGATPDNGSQFSPEIELTNVTKSGLQTIDKYDWVGPPAYRFVVGGASALPGPPKDEGVASYFQALRNMHPTNLAADMRAEFFGFLSTGAANDGTGGANWDANNNNDLALATNKFNRYFNNFNFSPRQDKFPVAGLPRNAEKGATWYPLAKPFTGMAICQRVLGYDGAAVAETGQEVVRSILDHGDGNSNAVTWRNCDIEVVMANQESMKKTFDQNGIVPPGISRQGVAAELAWRQGVGNVTEVAQTAAEDADQALIDAAEAAYDAGVIVVAQAQTAYDLAPAVDLLAILVAAQEALVVLLATWQQTIADLAFRKTLRVPHFDNWYRINHAYNGRVEFSIATEDGIDDLANPNLLLAFGDKSYVLQKMMMIRQQIGFYKAGDVQEFAFADEDVTHAKNKLRTVFYHLLCDVEEGYGTIEPVIRASGSVRELFETTQYVDANDGDEVKQWHLVDISLPADSRAVYHAAAADADGPATQAALALVNAEYGEFTSMGVGSTLELTMLSPPAPAVPTYRPHLIASTLAGTANAAFLFQDLAFGFESPRLFFFSMNNIGLKTENHANRKPDVYYFSTADCALEVRQQTAGGVARMHVCTRVSKAYRWEFANEAPRLITAADFEAHRAHAHGHMLDSVCICQLGPEFQELWFGSDGYSTFFDEIREESRVLGPVFRSQQRISQHLCAPILNPNARLQCSAPLNYETRHLPPEIRDFVIRLEDVDWSFLPGTISMEPLTLYEFNGGNQAPAARDSLLHLPQFREASTTELTDDGKFDFEVFSPYGMPSYIAIFARDTDFTKNYETQPLVTQLSIMCNTTMKKSNTILNADVHQLYHITQRNVHPRAEFDRFAFNKRQVILLRAEDIGLLGLHASEYQYEKRAQFRFQGSVDQGARVTALLIFNNRGLHVHGKQLSVERLVRRR